MRYPDFLNDNGIIGFVAPSFGCNTEPYYTAFKNALLVLKKKGYQIDLGPNCFEGKGIGISNTPRRCGEEFSEYYCSDENDVLLSCGGGELMCEILDYVDFEKIKMNRPKWFMGYSDNTNLTFLLTTICDVASIYGPCAPTFGMEPWHLAIEDSEKLLRGEKLTVTGYERWERESKKDEEHPLMPYHVTEKRILKVFAKEEYVAIKGRLLGGCMDCLRNLIGTRYDYVAEFNRKYHNDGVIWYLESCDLNVMDIRRALWQMFHAGWFENAKGFLIGRPYHYGEEVMGLDQYHAVYDILHILDVPVVMDVDLGHLPPMMPLINGAYSLVNVRGNDIQIEMRTDV